MEDSDGTNQRTLRYGATERAAVGARDRRGLIFAGIARADEAKAPIKVTVLYGAPKDPAAFETYYAKTHMPMVYAVKGIAKIGLGKPLPNPDGKAPAFYRITELWFENPPAMQAVMARPEWKKIVDDVPNFSSFGATILVSSIE